MTWDPLVRTAYQAGEERRVEWECQDHAARREIRVVPEDQETTVSRVYRDLED